MRNNLSFWIPIPTVYAISTLQYLSSVSGITDDELVEFFNDVAGEDPEGTTLPLAVLFYSERLLTNANAKYDMRPIVERLANRFGDDYGLVKKLVS